MSETASVVVLWLFNAIIAGVFAKGVSDSAEGWGWPPSWLRTVAAWLLTKGVMFLGLGYLWWRGRVRFTDEATAWDHWIYVGSMFVFTLFHLTVAIYRATGRAVLSERVAAWTGTERRNGPGRREKDRAPDPTEEQER